MEENQCLCLRCLLDTDPPPLHTKLRCKAEAARPGRVSDGGAGSSLTHPKGKDLSKGNTALEVVCSSNSRLSWLLCFQMCIYAPPHWFRAADMPRDQEDDFWGNKKKNLIDTWSLFYHKRGRASCAWQVLVVLCNSVLGSTQVLPWEGTCVRTDVKLAIYIKTTLAFLWVPYLERAPYKYFQR